VLDDWTWLPLVVLFAPYIAWAAIAIAFRDWWIAGISALTLLGGQYFVHYTIEQSTSSTRAIGYFVAAPKLLVVALPIGVLAGYLLRGMLRLRSA
jgi:hypothetical protein